MGLDMYLTAERYYRFNETKPEIPEIPQGFELKKVTVEAAYWRKANQIHKWFVDNIQGGKDECQPHGIFPKSLIKLRNLCTQVLEDPSLAEELLPVQAGFFFGSYDYDEGYFEDLEETVKMINKVLEAFPEGKWNFKYQSSW